MKTIELKTKARTETGTGPNRRLRRQGEIPTILYGLRQDPVMLSINSQDFMRASMKAAGEMVMYKLLSDGTVFKEQLAVIRDVQRDPVTERVVHMDMFRVDMSQPIDVEISIHGVGVPKGIRDGGILEHNQRTLHIRCLPTLVPSHIDINISELGVGDALHISDLQLGEGIEVLSNASDVVFHLAIPRMSEPEPTAAAAATGAAEPEVVAKKKEKEEA
jgi:large subunit ribosomal protein L25